MFGNSKAKWIWGSGENSPRNEWRCFQKTFNLNVETVNHSNISITADSRYILYINGMRVGRGPVRSWPFELAYDTYQVAHLLKPGDNTISVMVMHFGVTNFYYLRGQGGLLVQMDISHDKGNTKIHTDYSWKTNVYEGYDKRSPRMSCQQGFAERVDARLGFTNWRDPDFDTTQWKQANEIGEVGIEPWSKLVPKDIPHLTEEVIYPKRVESLYQTKPICYSTNIDIRNHVMPDSVNHANHVIHVGYISTLIKLEEAGKVTLGFVDSQYNFGPCSINGKWYQPDEFTGEAPEKYLSLSLEKGEHLFIMETSGMDHGDGFHFAVDTDVSFELLSPCKNKDADSPYITIGPFATVKIIDHQNTENPLPNFKTLKEKLPTRSLSKEEKAYLDVLSVSTKSELLSLQEWIFSIPEKLVSRDDVFALSIWKREKNKQKVPLNLQNIVIPNHEPGIIPLQKGYETEIIIDFEKEYSGFIEFEIEAAEGTIIDIYGFEYMHKDWRQDTYRLDPTIRYTCHEGRQKYLSSVRRGFRYLMLTVKKASRPMKMFNVRVWQSNYPLAEIGKFQSSNALLNDIWQISQHTTRICMEDTFVDCPAYEQVFWVGDSRNEALINYYLFGVDALVKRCLNLVPGSKSMTPLYVNQVPSGWNSVIPNWTFFWAIACHEYYEHSGDIEFAKEVWPKIKYTLDHYLEFIDSRNLLFMKGWNFLDWSPIDQPNHGVVSHQNMFLVKTLLSSAQLASAVNDEEEALKLKKSADNLRKAINAHLWSEQDKAFIDCIHADGERSESISMQTQVVALLCDIAEGKRKKYLETYLLAPPDNFIKIGSAFMSFFYYEALSKIGETETIVQDILNNYEVMIQQDSSTVYEMYPTLVNGKINPKKLTRSHCHAWSAAPGYFMGVEILGVRRETVGWKRLSIKPQPTPHVTWAKGTIPLPQGGRVDVSWSVDESNEIINLFYDVPEGHEVEVHAPKGYEIKYVYD